MFKLNSKQTKRKTKRENVESDSEHELFGFYLIVKYDVYAVAFFHTFGYTYSHAYFTENRRTLSDAKVTDRDSDSDADIDTLTR